MPLNTTVKWILQENKNAGCFRRPFAVKALLSNRVNSGAYYKYHKERGQLIEECFSSKKKKKKQIDIMICKGDFARYAREEK